MAHASGKLQRDESFATDRSCARRPGGRRMPLFSSGVLPAHFIFRPTATTRQRPFGIARAPPTFSHTLTTKEAFPPRESSRHSVSRRVHESTAGRRLVLRARTFARLRPARRRLGDC